jgi:chromosome segregation ATPase
LGNYQPDVAPQVSAAVPKMGLKEMKELRRAEAEARKAQSAARRALEKRVTDLEREIHSLEERQRELTQVLESPETYENPALAMETNRELSGVAEALEKANAEWMAAAASLEKAAA